MINKQNATLKKTVCTSAKRSSDDEIDEACSGDLIYQHVQCDTDDDRQYRDYQKHDCGNIFFFDHYLSLYS